MSSATLARAGTAPARARARAATVAPASEAVLFLAALSLLAAAIHGVVAVPHFEEYFLFGLLFVVSAVAQAGLALMVYSRPGRAVLMANVLLNAGIIAVWILSRTSGLPIGPEAGSPEAVELADLGAAACEAALAAVSLLLLHRRIGPGPLPVWGRNLMLVVLIFGGVALLGAPGHHH